ncbi:40S ribosomal protein S4, X isoform-like [Cervus elaphus]|uniref:40S ribosomal protein S4, X isoform-like n=1 Tax=Cervus elaphus TaxID=9860 RepID=UPI001CC2D991|nr:40S ribosomal protein S4, X isoform-like [Cervus elaphus]
MPVSQTLTFLKEYALPASSDSYLIPSQSLGPITDVKKQKIKSERKCKREESIKLTHLSLDRLPSTPDGARYRLLLATSHSNNLEKNPNNTLTGLQNKTVLPAPELIGKMYIQQVGTGDVGHTPQQPTYFLLAEIVEQSEKVGKKAGLQNMEAPKHWMLDKLTGVFAPCPSTASHKLRECLPLIIFLKSRFKYALTGDEMKKICMQHFIKIKGKVHTNTTYPTAFMNVISVDKTGENFHLIYDTKDRFAVHCIERQPFSIIPEEAKYKLCKVRKIFVGIKGIPHLVTHDARTIHYPNPLIKVNDTIQIDLGTGKITDFIKFDTGNLCMMMGGANLGRICVITNRERHPGSFDVVHVKDANGNNFATWLSNIFIIGKGNIRWISLPRGKGIRLSIADERDKRLAAKQSSG